MKNFVQEGEVLEFTAPGGGVTSGTPVVIGKLLVIPTITLTAAQVTAGENRFNGMTVGVFEVTKVGSQAWTEGAIVYWDNGNSRFTTTAGGNRKSGTAVEAVGAGASETTGIVRLDGVGVA